MKNYLEKTSFHVIRANYNYLTTLKVLSLRSILNKLNIKRTKLKAIK